MKKEFSKSDAAEKILNIQQNHIFIRAVLFAITAGFQIPLSAFAHFSWLDAYATINIEVFMMQQKTPFIETVFGMGLLCVAGGFLDAYSYTVRGGVLATAQTGNFVFLCVAIAAGSWLKAARYLIPIFFFCAGTFAGHTVKAAAKRKASRYWRCIVLIFEVATLVAVAFLSSNAIANALISFVSGVQLCIFRVADGNAAATTMCTGNLRCALDALFEYRTTGERKYFKVAACYFCMIALFLLGAFGAACAAPALGTAGVLLACAPMLAACAIHRAAD